VIMLALLCIKRLNVTRSFVEWLSVLAMHSMFDRKSTVVRSHDMEDTRVLISLGGFLHNVPSLAN
jgi:hypothetical protein